LPYWSRRSLAFTLAALIVAVCTVALGLSGMVLVRGLRTRERGMLERQAALSAQAVAESLALPVWNFDDEQIGRILEGALQDQAVVGVRLRYDGPNRTLFHAGGQARVLFRPGVPVTSPEELSHRGYLVESRPIPMRGSVLGTLDLVLTYGYLERDLVRFRATFLGGLVLFDLGLVSGLYLLLWRFVVRPIRRVERFADTVARGGRPQNPLRAGRSFRELEGLRRSIVGMVELLDQRYNGLMASERRYRALFNGSRDAILVRELRLDEPKVPFLEVNEAACRMLGYSREELTRLNAYDLYAERSWESLERLRAVLAERGSGISEAVFRTKDGRELQVELSAQYFELAGRNFVLAVARDHTERHQLELQLRQSQKMESLGLMAGGIAHDFNNILQVITGYAGTLEELLPAEGRGRRSAEQIQGAVRRATQLTHSLLAFSRKESFEPRPVELGDLVRQVEAFLKRVIGEDIDLVARLCSEPLDVLGDRGQIEQVLVNLAANARDAMPRGGILRIETELVTLEPDFIRAHGFGSEGAWVRITVSDSGHGMDEATRQRIFDPFFTTKGVGKGTGLGLAIVYGIVKQHNGQVNVYSEPGRGTTFRIYLPQAAQGVAAAAAAPPVEGSPRGSETILVAEDDPSVRELTRSVLADHGYQVILAEDGQEAVERFRSCGGRVDLLLMDLIMPRMSGKEAFERIRRDWPEARVLFTSGYTADIIQSRGELDERAELLMKPIAPRDLLGRIRTFLDR